MLKPSAAQKLEEAAAAVDAALDRADSQALDAAVAALDELRKGDLTAGQRGRSHYYSANALAGLRTLAKEEGIWWKQAHLQGEILHLRLALAEFEKEGGSPELLRARTNLGNAFSAAGRFVEALSLWNTALTQDASFGMALANRGLAYFWYARYVTTQPEQTLLLRDARESLQGALRAGVEDHAGDGIASMYKHVDSLGDWSTLSSLQMPLAAEMCSDEREYRNWCRREGLYLSPLNDLARMGGIDDIRDTLLLPDITVAASDGSSEHPVVIGMFNQAKQEYTSARYLAFEALKESEQDLHFADRGVVLLNALDYRLYRLWVERLKMAFISAHAIFDKLAYLMNEYWKLGLEPHQVSFGGLWYKKGQRRNGISPRTKELPKSWALSGLFWLSQEFYDDAALPAHLAPDSRMVHEIRNHIAHKYLRVHDELVKHFKDRHELPKDFSFQVTGTELQEYTLQLLRLVRSAMIYLTVAMTHEEAERAEAMGSKGLVAPMPVFQVRDDDRL